MIVFELRLHRFLVCSGVGNHFQYSRLRSALQLLGCGLVLRRRLREAGEQVGSSSRRDGLFFLLWLRLVFHIRLMSLEEGIASLGGHRLSRRVSPLEEGLASLGGHYSSEEGRREGKMFEDEDACDRD